MSLLPANSGSISRPSYQVDTLSGADGVKKRLLYPPTTITIIGTYTSMGSRLSAEVDARSNIEHSRDMGLPRFLFQVNDMNPGTSSSSRAL
ncbi:hypothetical protein D9611_012222 [Ephemerocybe angulata]|uniref:Uncharacterized protein n=1 Tax=Ephemerocybe angulata TaxID=980116 RepID=A0A8H5C5I4_9AGAR|nr:hypothetical protein D9611_012222 [Tulosesus angulatus]